MLSDERKVHILRLIQEKGIVKNKELRTLLNASESSLRRDLLELEEEKLIRRVHGGAVLYKGLEPERNMKEKSSKNVQEKSETAKIAAALIEENDVLFLDAGTTTGAMIPYLRESQKKMTVVTNSVHHADKLSCDNITVIILGGTIKQATEAVIGSVAVKQLQNYRFHKVFLGMNGIDPKAGYTTPDLEEAAIKEVAIAQSLETFILADESKLGVSSFVKVAEIEAASLITNAREGILLQKIKEKTAVIN